MDKRILKAFYLYYKDIKTTNKHFARKVKKLGTIKDAYYAYAFDLWNEKDERLKCALTLDIYKWIEEFEEISDQEKRKVLLYVLHTLSDSCLKEKVTNHALALAVIRGGIGDNSLERKMATEGLLQLIETARKQSLYYLSKSLKTKHIADPVDTIFYRIMIRLEDEEYFYISLVDGSYWHDLLEIIGENDVPVASLLTDLIARRQNFENESISDLRIDEMEYMKSTLSGLYKECTIEFLIPRESIDTLDTFGIGFAQYIEYVIFIKKIQMLMPSWVTFSNYQAEHKKIALEQIFDKAPSSPLYWFCSFALESNKFLNKLKNQQNADDIYEIIKQGVFNNDAKSTHAVKFINSNLPTDTEETNLLKEGVRSLLDKGQLLNATIEYAYYLSCLHETLGVTEKRKSWFKKNINFILDSYDVFLNILRRTYVVIERRKMVPHDVAQNDLEYQDKQQKEIAKYVAPTGILFDSADSTKAIQAENKSYKWQCLDMKILIQVDSESTRKIIEINKDDALEQIDQYLSKLHIDSMITPRHILSTLDNHINTNRRQHRDLVRKCGFLWRKIKRGKTRLLVRPVVGGLVFSVYKRQYYYHGMFK